MIVKIILTLRINYKLDGIDNRRFDSDMKEQQKLNYLRHQREQREYNQWRSDQEKQLKENAKQVIMVLYNKSYQRCSFFFTF